MKLTDAESYTGTLLMKLLCVMECNIHYVGEKSEIAAVLSLRGPSVQNQTVIGNASFVLQNFVNHSCNANVFRQSYKNYMLLYALQPIAQNEPVRNTLFVIIVNVNLLFWN